MKDHVGIQFKTHKWKRLVENVLRPLYTSIGSQEAAEIFPYPMKIKAFVRYSLIMSYARNLHLRLSVYKCNVQYLSQT